MIGLGDHDIVFGRGITPSEEIDGSSDALARLADLLSLGYPDWYVLTLARDAEDADKLDLVTDDYLPLENSLQLDADRRLVICFLAPEAIHRTEWLKIRTFHERHGRRDSPLFIGHPVGQTMSPSPIWLDAEFTRCATYIVHSFMFHALARLE